jgi:hypothetical protein
LAVFEDLEQLVQTEHRDHGSGDVAHVAEANITFLGSRFAHEADEHAHPVAGNVGQLRAVDHDPAATLLEELGEAGVELLDGVPIDESEQRDDRSLALVGDFDPELLLLFRGGRACRRSELGGGLVDVVPACAS